MVVVLGLIMSVYSLNQYRKYRLPSRVLYAAFWGFLAMSSATDAKFLLIPATVFWLWGSYYKFIVKDSCIAEAKELLHELKVSPTDPEEHLLVSEEENTGLPKAEIGRTQKQKDEYIPTAVAGYTQIAIQNPYEQIYRTDTGETLVVGKGEVSAAIRLSFQPERSDDEINVLLVQLRIADDMGSLWECRSFLLPDLMTSYLESETTKPASGFTPWADAPQSWKDALKQRCLLPGVLNLMDSRDISTLQIGSSTYEIIFKYQGPRIDIGYLEADSSLVVRISGLYHYVKENGIFDYVEVPPFAFAIPVEQFVFMTAPEYYYASDEEWMALDDETKPPYTFSRVNGQDKHQSSVRVLQGPSRK